MDCVGLMLGVVCIAIGLLTFAGWGLIASKLDSVGRLYRGIGVLLLSACLFMTVLTDDSGRDFWLWISVAAFIAGLGLIFVTTRRVAGVHGASHEESAGQSDEGLT